MTYGDIPATEHQHRFDQHALGRFEALPMDLSIPDERRYKAPVTAEERYPLDGEQDTAGKTHIVLGWLLGKSADLRGAMNAHVLSSVLLDNSASPLRHALETTFLGSAPSEICGMDDSTREAIQDPGFIKGLAPQLLLDSPHRVRVVMSPGRWWA